MGLREDILREAASRNIDPYREPFKPSELGLISSSYGSFSDYCADTTSSKWNKQVILKAVESDRSGRPLRYVLLR